MGTGWNLLDNKTNIPSDAKVKHYLEFTRLRYLCRGNFT